MELRHLRYFLAVVESRTFTRAAASQFIAQSALSQQIARLEDELGAPLLIRGRRGADLTEAGRLLLPFARRMLADAQAAQSQIQALGGLQRGHLRLGLIQTGASGLDSLGLIGAFHSRYPGIELSVTNEASADMLTGVMEGELDLALVGLDAQDVPAGLHLTPLVVDPLVAVLSSEGAATAPDPIDVRDLLGLGPFVQFRVGSGLRRHVTKAFERARVEPAPGFELDQVGDIVRLAALGVGVSIVPRAAIELSAQPAIGVLSLSDAEAVHPVGLIHDPQRLSAAANAFMELVVDAVGR